MLEREPLGMAPSVALRRRFRLRLLVSRRSAIVLLPLLALTAATASPWTVNGRSMEPALADRSLVLVDVLGPRITGYQRGDIVVLLTPTWTRYPTPLLIKRIVGIPGDRIVVKDGVLYRNGIAATEPYLAPGTRTLVAAGELDVVVPAGSVFVMGDHRENSFDSKVFGPLPDGQIVGRAWLAVAPEGRLELPGAAAGSN